ANIVRQIAEQVRQPGLRARVPLKGHVPGRSGTAVKGIQTTRQSAQSGDEHFEEQRSPSGRRVFWSVWKEPTGDAEGTDVWAAEHGFAAVTPLRANEFDQNTYDTWRARVVPR